MSKARFLFDECTAKRLMAALLRIEPAIDALHVGDPGAPPKGTLDPDLLIATEGLGRVLVTNDKSTMPQHLRDHYQAGHHTAGVIILRQGFSIGRLAQEIHQQWVTTTADEWIDRIIVLPL